MPKWQITLNAQTITEDDVTVNHCVLVNEMTGQQSWDDLDPMHSPATLAAWATVCAAQDGSMPLAEAQAVVGRLPMRALLATLTTIDDTPASADGTPGAEGGAS